MGGCTVRDKHGGEHYSRIGRQGGETTKAKHGTEHYVRIGRIGGSSRRKQDPQEGEA
jgi:hypothetical protein